MNRDFKNYYIIDLDNGGSAVETIALTEYKKLVRIEVTTFDEAVEKLNACEDKAEIIYKSNQPVNGLQMNALRAIPSFVKFSPRPERESADRAARKLLTDDALFKSFYQEKRAKEADDDTVDLFMRALKGEELQ